MRRVRYNVAASLDGYIAGPNGEFDWIPDDPAVDFATLFRNVDTVLLGRVSYELTLRLGGGAWPAGSRVYVFSRTLAAADHPEVTVVTGGAADVVAQLRSEAGSGDIWLYGGGELFRSLLEAGQVDAVEVTVVPVLLGRGIKLLPDTATRTRLALTTTLPYPSGMIGLHYDVVRH